MHRRRCAPRNPARLFRSTTQPVASAPTSLNIAGRMPISYGVGRQHFRSHRARHAAAAFGPWRYWGAIAAVIISAVFALVAPGHIRHANAATIAVTNASLETDANADGMPDCWQHQGTGRYRYQLSRTTTAHSGTYAEQLTIGRYWTGWQGLLIQMGSSACGPSLVAGHTYALSAWYQARGDVRFTAYYRTTAGSWVQWTTGPALAPAAAWTQGTFATPPLPSDATRISFGLTLHSTGSLTTDDYALSDTSAGSASSSAPATTTASTSSAAAPASSASSSSAPASSTAASTSNAPAPVSSSPASPASSTSSSSTTSSVPPPAGGYFPTLVAPGNVAALPSGSTCANLVHRSTWEPRPDNTKRNNTLVNPTAVHDSFAARNRSVDGTYDPRWDSWLLPRVDGQFTGTTDEIIQWAACKWGLPDDYLRAEADIESTWYQYLTYPSGRCVDMYGCGDWFSSEPYSARKTYCDGLASSGGYDYQKDFGDGLCPKTFSIVGIMSWWNPSWGYNWAGNQDGTFPFTRDSTAMALDYMASQIRGCYEGWQWELGSSYKAGDLWGCAGAWYSGNWHDSAAETYISHVQNALSTKPWLAPGFASDKPSCSPTYGCPGTDPL